VHDSVVLSGPADCGLKLLCVCRSVGAQCTSNEVKGGEGGAGDSSVFVRGNLSFSYDVK
jgi:hypothetical protein